MEVCEFIDVLLHLVVEVEFSVSFDLDPADIGMLRTFPLPAPAALTQTYLGRYK
jgi:hypothetical protein